MDGNIKDKNMRMKSYTIIIIFSMFVFACSNDINEERLIFVSSLFTGEEQYENFNRVYEIFPTSKLSPSNKPLVFKKGNPLELPSNFVFKDKLVNVNDYLSRTDTSALVILKDGKISYENYWLTGGERVHWLSMSVAKSFISALIGIAIDQGYIKSINDEVTDYVPQLKESAYENVQIKDILQMSSGASWNEDYSDPNSDINRSSKIFAVGGSLDEFTASLEKELKPGSFNRYNSTDTQVLGMLLREATKTSITKYMEEMLWHPMGVQDSGYWLLDSKNMEMVYAGFNATARDYAKLGELYRLGGIINSKQIIPRDWVNASIKPDAPHLMPGSNPLSDFPLGYGYQWWVPDLSGDFSAIGVYNQFIYVSPESKMVIVKLSANSNYGTSKDLNAVSELETIEFFKTLINLGKK